MKPVRSYLFLACAVAVLCGTSCGKDSGNGDGVDTSKPPVDPPVAKTIGFVMDEWQSRSFSVPTSAPNTVSGSAQYVVTVDPYKILTKIPQAVFGDNANVYTTQFVNEPVLMNNINQLDPSFIRYPGGDNSSLFFWNANEGVLPADVPAQLLDKDGAAYTPQYRFGKSNAVTTLSLDNYYAMLQQTGSKGIISVNYSYARYSTADNPVAAAGHLAADWVRYDNGRTRYWEIGNENYGNWQAGYRINTGANKDGQPQIITGDLYADHLKVIADSMRKAAAEIGKTIYLGAVLVEGRYTSSTPTEIDWNVSTIKKVHALVDFYSLHNYYTPFGENSTAAYVLYSPANSTKLMADYINQAFKTAGVEAKPLALTEYNINAISGSQTPSFVNGMHGIATIGESLKNNIGMAARNGLTDIWANGNSLGLFNLGDEPGGVTKFTPRAPFYYYYYFRKFLGDRLINSTLDKANAELLTYASTFNNGYIGLTILNKSDAATTVKVETKYWKPTSDVYWYVLNGGTDNGEFSRKVFINGNGPDGVTHGPANYSSLPAYSAPTGNGILIEIPKRGAVMLAYAAGK